MKLVVDVSSIVKTCLYAGTDKEFGRKVVFEGKDVQINSAEYGVDNAINHVIKQLNLTELTPRDMILVVEGMSSKALRTAMWEGYKANRGEDAPERNVEFAKARLLFTATFLDLGAQAVTQPGVEADDVIAFLAKTLPNCIIDSNDGDMAALISETAHVLKDGKLDENPYGVFPTRFIPVYKALVGDTRDNIKGARGFGPKAFLDLYCMWGDEGLEAMEDLIRSRTLERLVEDVGQLKSLQKILDDQQGVYLSYDLARMYPEKVNTYRNPLRWDVGMVKPKPAKSDPRLVQWYGRRKVVHAGNYAAVYEWVRENVANASRVGLDIETYAPEESDEWLEQRKKRKSAEDDLGVDTLGSRLVSMGLTLGDNDQFTHYFAVDHNGEDGYKNITKQQLAEIVKLIPRECEIVVHNAAFELSVLHREIGVFMMDNGYHGFLPNIRDTKVLCSYADENQKQGLKDNSKRLLKYDQVTYKEVTKGRKMHQMSATETLDYGADDPICTLALYNHFRTVCEIENTWTIYLEVEVAPAYLDALRFNQGTPISMEELLKQEHEDQEAYDRGWEVVQKYLISKGWAGTTCPRAAGAADVTAAFIKDAYAIVTGLPRDSEARKEAGIEDAFLGTRVRTPDKLVKMLEATEDPNLQNVELLAAYLGAALAGQVDQLNGLLKLKFDNTPDFNVDSSVQMCRLLYEVMGLPIRLRNKRTDAQREAGQEKGNPKGDDLALQYALKYDVKSGTQEYDVLKAIQAMKIANTRRKLYYVPYRTVLHWTDGLVHSYLNQCAAITRRYSESGPNKQQLPKHPKATGEPPKFRRVYVPHHRRAVVASLDFTGQELVIIAERSRDENLLACFIGDNKKDVHTLTASGILRKKALARETEQLWTMAGRPGLPNEEFTSVVLGWKDISYEGFKALEDGDWARLYKTLRALGKKTNFTTEYGAMAPKLAVTLLIEEDEAQDYIDAKLAQFPGAEKWKKEVIARMHDVGYTTTLMGARRHLYEGLLSGNSYEIGSAERQGVNFEIQGSAAEQTKLAMARLWNSDVFFRYDARFIGPVHDELVFSVCIDDLVPFLQEVHTMMVAPYAGMIVPIKSEISFGLNYGEQHEVGATVVPDVIVAKIAELFPNEPANAPWREEMKQAA